MRDFWTYINDAMDFIARQAVFNGADEDEVMALCFGLEIAGMKYDKAMSFWNFNKEEFLQKISKKDFETYIKTQSEMQRQEIMSILEDLERYELCAILKKFNDKRTRDKK